MKVKSWARAGIANASRNSRNRALINEILGQTKSVEDWIRLLRRGVAGMDKKRTWCVLFGGIMSVADVTQKPAAASNA